MNDPWPEANRDFFASGVWQTIFDTHGRRIVKYPTDLYVYEEIIRAAKPQVIVETGSAEGGSAAWFAERAPEVISVDLHPPYETINGVLWVRGDSTDPEVIEYVYRRVDTRPCLVTLDSDHNADHVLEEMEAYARLVSPGSYLVVEDTAVDLYGLNPGMYPRGGPGVAVTRYLGEHTGWTPDPECERFRLGMNPGGWLRRG